jgi:hypothetical protein
MDIYECHDRYRITLKKLRHMHRDGVLKIEKDKTPEYWLRAISDIQKGKLSARSIALAALFPEKLDKIYHLTRQNRRILDSHFKSIKLTSKEVDLSLKFVAAVGAVEKHPILLADFIAAVQKLIPSHDVNYHYLAVRILLTCETDHQVSLMAEYMTRAFSSIRDESAMRGWWHTEPGAYGKNHTIYHRPIRYDL